MINFQDYINRKNISIDEQIEDDDSDEICEMQLIDDITEILNDNDSTLDEVSVGAQKTWHYTKAVGRNLLAPTGGHIRRALTQRHVDRYKMHQRILKNPNATAAQKKISAAKMVHHKAQIFKRMEHDQ